MWMDYALTPDSVFKSVPPNGWEPTSQTSTLYLDIVPLIYVNETICMVIWPSTRFKSIVLWPGMNHLVPRLFQIHLMDERPGAILSFKTFLSFINRLLVTITGFPGGSEFKVSAWNAGDPGSIPGLGRSPGEGNGNPLQYSCLENPMDRGAWWATVYGVAKSWIWLSN